MPSPKKILFVYCSTGLGHSRVAETLFLACQKNHPDIEAKCVDIADYSSKLLDLMSVDAYHFGVKKFPKLYKLIYESTDFTLNAKFLGALAPIIRLNSLKLLKFVKEFQPDRIVCTHFLPPAILKVFKLKIPIDVVVTDYYAHKIWLANNAVRYFFVATKEIKENTKKTNIIVSGMPVHPKFFGYKDPAAIKAKFGLNNDWPTVLLMSGGMGLVNTSYLAKNICNNLSHVNLVAIAGRSNKKLFEKLSNIRPFNDNNYKVIQFTNDIDELMRVSDVIITKPGGITISECLFLQKPIIMVNPIPGQEEHNAEYVVKKHYGFWLKHKKEISALLQKILQGEEVLEKQPLPKVDPSEIILETALNYKVAYTGPNQKHSKKTN